MSTIEMNGAQSDTDHEQVGTAPAGSVPDGAAPGAATTYESPTGAGAVTADPDAESSGAAAPGATADAGVEFGLLAPGTAASASETLPDAILGSYPEFESVSEVIIGADNRVKVGNTATYPWSAIVHLRIVADNGSVFVGSGFLVSPRTIITAGHCVFMHANGGWARSIEVTPGRNGTQRPFGTFTAPRSSLRSVTGWTSDKKREQDYGAIILPAGSRPGDRTGTFGFATRNDAFLLGSSLNLSGYPGDKPQDQWFMAQRTKSVSSRVITYDIDTVGGQSGSPVWVLQNNQRHAVGIHTNGATSGNSATRVVTAVFDRIKAWKNEGL